MKYKLIYAITLLMLLISGVSNVAIAQIMIDTGKVNSFKTAVEATPDSLPVHQLYIKAMGIHHPGLIVQYNKWIEKYPRNINFPAAIGQALYNAELPQAKAYLLKIVKAEPGNAKTWFMLYVDALRWGQDSLSAEYMRKAALADPNNPDYALYYASTFQNGDPAAFRQKMLDLAKRFPENGCGAQAIYLLAEASKDTHDRIKYYEMLRKLYPPQRFTWSEYGMKNLWAIYLETDLQKALGLATEMSAAGDANSMKRWKKQEEIAANFITARQLAANNHYKDAIAVLAKIKLPRYSAQNDFYYLEQATVYEKSGDIKRAYDTLSIQFAHMPTEKLASVMAVLAKKLGKNEEDLKTDIKNIRYGSAAPAYPFDLELYTQTGKLSLQALKGKVVLLTFWFPGCGPCRAEFPHFQHVIDKFKGRDVVYIGINVTPGQDEYVLPFLKNTKYSFIPLHGNAAIASAYHVIGEPTNFLIDKNGKVVFNDFRTNGNNEDSLTLMISSLL